jgi:hypothetical protein
MGAEFTCEACGETFPKAWTDEDAHAEASAVFRPEEREDEAVVCDGCWRAMRADMPDLDARYREQGL